MIVSPLSSVEKFTDEILLAFAGDFRCFGGDVTAVAVEMGAFLDLEEAELHTALCGQIVADAVFDKMTFISQPPEQPLLPHINAVLF